MSKNSSLRAHENHSPEPESHCLHQTHRVAIPPEHSHVRSSVPKRILVTTTRLAPSVPQHSTGRVGLGLISEPSWSPGQDWFSLQVWGGLSEGGQGRAARCHYPLPRSLKRLPESPALSSNSIISAPGALSQRGWNPGLGRTCWRMFKPLVGAARCLFKIFSQAAERAWSVLLGNSDSPGTRGRRCECRTFPSITEPRPLLALQAGPRVAGYPSWWQVAGVWILASPWGLSSSASRSAATGGQ